MDDLQIGLVTVAPGEVRDLRLKISETYTGDEIFLPVRVIRSAKAGPTVLVTAAVHGDEINGTGVVHELMFQETWNLQSGSLVLVPVVNVFGFENHDRYLPDRRDLNRSFPGSEGGSLASRIAHTLMTQVITRCNYCIDLHSAAFQRTNYPNVRGDLRDKGVRKLARAFGCALVVDGKGPEGSLRREACRAGVPTIILEAGEPSKVEPTVLEIGVRGVKNVLRTLGMLNGKFESPPYTAKIQKTTWLRAEVGGILRFHVSPGDLVEAGQAVASNFTIMGERQNTLYSPSDGIVLSLTTMPAVKPGEPVCYIALPSKKLATIRRELDKVSARGLYGRVSRDLATSVVTSEYD
jgi:hypothetical protein